MDRDAIVAKVLAYFRGRYPGDAERLGGSSRLTETLLLDSLAFMEVVMFLESEFGLRLERADVDAFETPESIADLVLRKRR